MSQTNKHPCYLAILRLLSKRAREPKAQTKRQWDMPTVLNVCKYACMHACIRTYMVDYRGLDSQNRGLEKNAILTVWVLDPNVWISILTKLVQYRPDLKVSLWGYICILTPQKMLKVTCSTTRSILPVPKLGFWAAPLSFKITVPFFLCRFSKGTLK